ncbi:MAG: methyltransferase [Microcystis sp.]|jgi:SAM-dependent methyltransferase|uniref:methyltransferase n=1 Tax=Microcystis sp. TaxID=1127 RepID=UPI003919760B
MIKDYLVQLRNKLFGVNAVVDKMTEELKKLKTELKPESLALNSQFCQEILDIPSQDSMESLKLPSESTKFNGWQFNKIIQDWINLQTKYPDRFNSVIDEKDEMYTYLLNLYHGNNGQAILEYLSTGQQSMNVIKQICEWGFHGFQNISTFLDFASGYGRLTRFLVQELSPEKIWIADIYTNAVKFQEEQFGVHCITSVNSPTEFNVDMKYDCIFVGSLFSHLPPESFFEWLRKLYDLLSSNGILIFSVHDSAVSPDNLQIGEEGFLFLQHSESATLDKNEYGTMYVNEFFVGEAIKSVTGNSNFFRKPRGLWGFQDIYIVGKNSSNRFEDLNISSGSMGYLDRCYVTEEKELIFEGWAVESDKLLRLEDIQIFINNNLVDHCLPCYDRPDVAIAYQNDNFLRSGFRCCIPRAEFDFELSDIVCVKTINSQKIEKILRISTLEDLLIQDSVKYPDKSKSVIMDKLMEDYVSSLNLSGMSTLISEADEMYVDNNFYHYFDVTQSAINLIQDATNRFSKEITYILDMPSGHGRVCRGLRWLFPKQTIVTCDLNRDGVDFCSEQFGTIKNYSSEDIKQIGFSYKFDLIWCGSLITHLDESRGLELLKLLIDNLAEQGILLITSHGDTAVKNIINGESYGLDKDWLFDIVNSYYESGYGYHNYFNAEEYGISLINKYWFKTNLEKLNGKLLDYQESGWANHHDVAIIGKSS